MEIQLWRELLEPYQLAVDELLVKFRYLIDAHRASGMYSPIEEVNGRVKSISSILDKMQKKKLSFDDITTKIEDIAGIRIICQFVEDIEKVEALIKSRNDMEIKQVKDYITNSKPSGYRSYHMIVYYEVQTLKGSVRIPVEIQIRTLAMNFWATIEHSLQYKYRQNMPASIRERLSSAAAAVIQLDNEMSSVREEIMDAQISLQLKAHIVAEILNTIQNLYKAANKREIVKIQDEFYAVYRNGSVEELEQFGKELDIIAEGYKAQDVRGFRTQGVDG